SQKGRSRRGSGEPSPKRPSSAIHLHLAPIAHSESEQPRCRFPGQTTQPRRCQSVEFSLLTRGGGGLAFTPILDDLMDLKTVWRTERQGDLIWNQRHLGLPCIFCWEDAVFAPLRNRAREL